MSDQTTPGQTPSDPTPPNQTGAEPTAETLIEAHAGPEADRERVVREGFRAKLRRTLGRVPFAEEACAAYYCAIDPATPARVRAILIGALAYFVVPTDALPDFIAVLGFTDDATVFWLAVQAVSGHIREPHRSRARSLLAREQRAAEPGTGEQPADPGL